MPLGHWLTIYFSKNINFIYIYILIVNACNNYKLRLVSIVLHILSSGTAPRLEVRGQKYKQKRKFKL